MDNSWIEGEVLNQNMVDARLNKRMQKLLENLCKNPKSSIPNANGSWPEVFAAYRFLNNERVDFDGIMSGHQCATMNRISTEPVVLVPQDTTFLNFATDDKSKGMGTLRTKNSNQKLLHTSIAITPSRVNLGVIHANMWQRDKDSSPSRASQDISEKESQRWITHYEKACEIQSKFPEKTVVSIADREGDIHEWFQYAQTISPEKRASYIVRAKANRLLYVKDEETKLLWDQMNDLKSIGSISVTVPKRNGEAGRVAKLKIYSSEIELVGRYTKRQPIGMHAVYAKEVDPAKGKKGIEWMLLTDLPVETSVQARMIIDWYRCRWEIEMFFRVLKGGCDIQSNRFRTDGGMFNCIAVYMIIGWRLHSITMEARRDPDSVCTRVFSDKEWQILWRMRKKEKLPTTPPSIREMVRLLASLGGFLGRKHDGEPGILTVWRGYDKLLTFIEAADVLCA